MRLAFIALMATTLACSIDVTFPIGLACKTGPCPDGQRCVDDICVVGVDADAGTGDGGFDGDGGGGSNRACGGSTAFVEDFSDASSSWFINPLRPGVSVDGSLIIDVPDGATDALAASGPRLDLLESDWFAKVEPAANATTTFGIKNDGVQSLTISVSPSTVVFNQNDDGGTTIAFDATLHRYFGFRERKGSVEMLSSPDGVRFTAQRTVETPSFVERFQAIMLVERQGAQSATAIIDDINVGSPAHAFCPSSDFRDDFDGDSLSDQWTVFSCESVDVAGGEVIFTSAPGQFCVLNTANLHNLANSELEMELGSVFSGYFKYAIDGEFSEFVVERFDTELRVTDCVEGVCGAPVIAPYVGERYWRFRGDDQGQVTFSFSADGLEYQTVTTSSPFDITAVKARFHGNTGTENRVTRFN